MTSKKTGANGARVEMAFDLSKASARQLTPHLAELGKGKLASMAEILPLVATECPAEWGKPDDPATYRKLPLAPDLGLAWNALEMEVQARRVKSDAKFDLAGLTAQDYDELNAALQQASNPSSVAKLLAQYVQECTSPVIAGLDDPEAYLDLPYYTEFAALVRSLEEAASADLTNFRKRYIGR